ncbi:Kinesin-like protein kif9 [Allomyces arbusculus]|nr:Kinesin-like protein kif9 [Allomyces arbusculus]
MTDMMNNKHVRVVVRTRPTTRFASQAIEIIPDKNIVNIHVPKPEDAGFINNQQSDWSFKFDKLLHNASQDAVYEECGTPIVRSLLDGYNGTLLAYGQTGAGKTFTMTGATENYRHRGVIPRAISQVFKEIQARPQYAYMIRISYLEIYNENMIDLLAPVGQSVDMAVVEDKNGCYVKGLSQVIATNEEEALNLLFEGETARSVGDHALNRTSSRSHTVFTIHLESKSRVDSSDDVIFSKLNLVDLAGSERLAKTASSGKTLKEAMFINKSLTFLEQVIIALADKKRDHVPYRQSRLTNVLRDSLGGNCNTLMIANIWGEADHLEETISTLRFATRMSCVTNEPVVNVQYDPMTLVKKQEREIKELRQELAMYDTLIGRSHVQYEPFTDGQKVELAKRVRAWLDGTDDEIEIVTLRQVKEIMNVFKGMYLQWAQGGDRCELPKAGGAAGPAAAGGMERDISAALEEEDGVGETEGMGFSIGVAPVSGPNGRRKVINRKALPAAKKEPFVPNAASRQSSTSFAYGSSPAPTMGTTGSGGDDLSHSPGGSPEVQGASRVGEQAGMGQVGIPALQPLPPIPARAKPDRNEEFETFKRGPGKDLAQALIENKRILRDKKRALVDLTARVTTLKASITDLKTTIARDRDQALQADTEHDPALYSAPIPADVQAKLDSLATLKADAKRHLEAMAQTKSELEYAARVVDTCRERLVCEFDAWYLQVYCDAPAPAVVGEARPTSAAGRRAAAAVAATAVAGMTTDASVADPLDLAEQFDQMLNDKLMEDPASYSYYAALKRRQRRGAKPQARTLM